MKNSNCLAAPIIVMKFTGIWLPDNLTYRGKVAFLALRWGTQILLSYFIILAEIGYVYKFRHDTHRIVDAAVMLLAHLLQTVKVMTIIIRQERIKRLITLGDAIYAYSSLGVVNYALGVCAENLLVSGFLSLAAAQVGLLNELLLYLKTDGKDDCYKNTVWCVQFHQRIIEYVEEIAKIFGLTIFCQCFTSSVVVCFIAYKITITREPIELVTIIFYFVCMMMELIAYCYPADVLLNKSLQVSDAAYPEWTGNVKTARVLLLIAVRAQRPLVVNAGGMIRLSLPTAAAVVQTSYTYYALLRQKIKD